MSNAKTTTSSGGIGIGLAGATFLVFLCCKLTGQIDWSWWWVTAPLWGGFAIFLLGILVFLAFTGVSFLGFVIAEYIRERRR